MEQIENHYVVFAENQVLETERLCLRPLTLADAKDMFEYASDEETTTFVFPTHQTIEETRAIIASVFMADPFGKFALELKENHKMIGTIDLRVNIKEGTAEIGYTLNKTYWGQGLVPEAAHVLLALGFEKLQLIRIFAVHDLKNPKSGRVMEKIGMTKESTIYEAKKIYGKVSDIVTYGITKSQWQKAKEQ
jgi:ribosomal-protein-alanine N-acetyltransferase